LGTIFFIPLFTIFLLALASAVFAPGALLARLDNHAPVE